MPLGPSSDPGDHSEPQLYCLSNFEGLCCQLPASLASCFLTGTSHSLNHAQPPPPVMLTGSGSSYILPLTLHHLCIYSSLLENKEWQRVPLSFLYSCGFCRSA